MTLPHSFTGETLLPVAAWTIATGVLVVAWRHTPWRRLALPRSALVATGVVAALALLWHLRVVLAPSVALQLVGIAVVQAVAGARLALVAGAFAALAAAATGTFDLEVAPVHFVAAVAAPVAVLAFVMRRCVRFRARLPAVAAFVLAACGGAIASAGASVAGWMTTGAGAPGELAWSALVLLAATEAQLSALAVGALVLARPAWLDPRGAATQPDPLRVYRRPPA
jgi:uncharacterized membrane protein